MSALDIFAVIVSYRCAALTIEALRSLAAERATPGLGLQAIVVDNASGDLPQIQRAVEQQGWSSWVTLIAAPRNGGFAYGNNVGIERAFGGDGDGSPPYIYLLNPDAQVRSGAVLALARFLETHPTVGIAGSSFENHDGSEWPIAFRFPTLLSELDQGLGFGLVTRLLRRWVVARRMSKTSQPVDWICGASMMIRPAVLAAVGGFDENYFLYYEETDFCQRARRAGFSTWYVPESRVMHIAGQSTHVTERTGGPRRLPPYWFESRRRYFAVTFGVGKAIAIDLIAIAANSLGFLKRVCLGRGGSVVPHFTRDLICHSILRPANRTLMPVNCGGAARAAIAAVAAAGSVTPANAPSASATTGAATITSTPSTTPVPTRVRIT
jgi:N-acetylglucosaminyl-diphospho-decaprenol L-rhamnosyltransferase